MGTPTGLNSLIAAIYNTAGAAHYDSSNVASFNPLTTGKSSITYVEGDLTLGGGQRNNVCAVPSGYTNLDAGCGILVVTGTLTMSGNFSWYGIIFVVGDGHVETNGGGNGNIVGSLWVSKIWDSYTSRHLLGSLGSPTFNWNGGGGNGIYYDHCFVTNLMTAVPFDPPPSTRPLKVLSFRVLPY